MNEMLALYMESCGKVSVAHPETNEGWELLHRPSANSNYWQWRKITPDPATAFIKSVMYYEGLTSERVYGSLSTECRQQWDLT